MYSRCKGSKLFRPNPNNILKNYLLSFQQKKIRCIFDATDLIFLALIYFLGMKNSF